MFNKCKKIMSMFLAFTMLLGIFPAMAPPVLAAEEGSSSASVALAGFGARAFSAERGILPELNHTAPVGEAACARPALAAGKGGDGAAIQQAAAGIIALDDPLPVCMIGPTLYTSVVSAIADVENGQTIVLLQDTAIPIAFGIQEQQFAINLNGCSLATVGFSLWDNSALTIAGTGSVTIAGSGLDMSNSRLISNPAIHPIRITDGGVRMENKSSAYVSSIADTASRFVAYIWSGSTLQVEEDIEGWEGVYANGSNSFCTVRAVTATGGSEVTGVFATNSANVIVRHSAYGGTGVWAKEKSTITVHGHARGAKTGAYAYEGKVTVEGNAEGGVYGAYALWDGSVTVTGGVVGGQVGAYAEGEKAKIKVETFILANYIDGIGAYAKDGAEITAKLGSSGGGYGAYATGSVYNTQYAKRTPASVSVTNGNVSADKDGGVGAYADDDGQVTVSGNVTGKQVGAAVSERGIIKVGGNVSGGDIGATATDKDSVITVTGTAIGTAAGSTGAVALDGGRVEAKACQGLAIGAGADGRATVNPTTFIYSTVSITGGNAVATASGSRGALAINGGIISVKGNVQGEQEGAAAHSGGDITITGNATGGLAGALAADAGSSIKVDGNASATNLSDGYAVYSDQSANVTVEKISGGYIGAVAVRGGTVTVEDTISGCEVYAGLGNESQVYHKNQEDFSVVSTNPGYFTYTDGTSTVWVWDPIPLVGISVTTLPRKTLYVVDQELDLSGMKVTAAYENGSSRTVGLFSANPADGTVLSRHGEETVTITYIEKGETRTTSFQVEVMPRPVGFVITKEPDKTDYLPGETLDLTGMAVSFHYSDGGSRSADGYYTTYPDHGAVLNRIGAQAVTLRNTEFDLTASFNITVHPVPVTGITVTGEGDVDSITSIRGRLQMKAEIIPDNASFPYVHWSVAGSGSAPGIAGINSADGGLTAKGNGTVTVTAEALDGSGVIGTKEILISGQLTGDETPNTYEVGSARQFDEVFAQMQDNYPSVVVLKNDIVMDEYLVEYEFYGDIYSEYRVFPNTNIENKVVTIETNGHQLAFNSLTINNSMVTINGDIVADSYYGDSTSGIRIAEESFVEINGNLLGAKMLNENLLHARQNCEVIINGNVTSLSDSEMLWAANDSVLIVRGDITGNNKGVVAYGESSIVVVYGDITVEGEGYYGPTGEGVVAMGGHVTVNGDVYGSFSGISAYNAFNVTVYGDVSSAMHAVYADCPDGTIYITGDAAGGEYGIHSYEGDIIIGGSVSASDTGVYLQGGSVTIEGELTSDKHYIVIRNENWEYSYFEILSESPGSIKPGYDEYAFGSAVVWVKRESGGAELTGIEITDLPVKLSYIAGENLDLTGMAARAIYSDGNGGTITSYATEPANRAPLYKSGEQTVTVSYTEGRATKTADFTITVSLPEFTGELVEITGTDTDAIFIINAMFDDLCEVTLITGDGSYELTLEKVGDNKYALYNDELNGSAPLGEAESGSIIITLYKDFLAALDDGSYAIKASLMAFGATEPYAAAEAAFSVCRDDDLATLDSIVISALPDKLIYTVGDELELSGLSVTAVYSDASENAVTGYTTNPADGAQLNEVGTQTVTVSYTEGDRTETTAFDVKVNAAAHVHNHVEYVIAPTCTEQGYTEYKCDCGDKYIDEDSYIAALGHDFTVPAGHEDATCEANGYNTFMCSRCDETDTVIIPATGHDWGTGFITQPTCTEQGYTTYTCANCLETKTEDYQDPLDHTWDDGTVTKEPTEYEDGVKTYTCGRCGDTREETISALGHVHHYTTVVIEPTCTEQGYTEHKCDCGEDGYTDAHTAALGHDFTVPAGHEDATCEANGYNTFMCSRCDETDTVVIPATGHDWGAGLVTEPTCTEQGYTTYTCANCGDGKVADYTAALGHNFVLTDHKDPTADEDGYDILKCSRCDETKTVVIPKTGGVTIKNAVTTTKDFVSMMETAKNSRIWVLTFKAALTYSDGKTEVKTYSISLSGNNANLDGKYKFADGHDLAGYTLVYDVKGNGSNIKALSIMR